MRLQTEINVHLAFFNLLGNKSRKKKKKKKLTISYEVRGMLDDAHDRAFAEGTVNCVFNATMNRLPAVAYSALMC